jgi:hypothetical protein
LLLRNVRLVHGRDTCDEAGRPLSTYTCGYHQGYWDAADDVLEAVEDDIEAIVRRAGWERIGHDFAPKLEGPCDCPPRTSWDPHYTCRYCGAYDAHVIHGRDSHAWRRPASSASASRGEPERPDDGSIEPESP